MTEPNGPCLALETKPLASLSQRDEIGNQYFSQKDDAASACTLYAAADEEGREVLHQRSDNCSDSEKTQGEEDRGLASQSVEE